MVSLTELEPISKLQTMRLRYVETQQVTLLHSEVQMIFQAQILPHSIPQANSLHLVIKDTTAFRSNLQTSPSLHLQLGITEESSSKSLTMKSIRLDIPAHRCIRLHQFNDSTLQQEHISVPQQFPRPVAHQVFRVIGTTQPLIQMETSGLFRIPITT